MTMQRITRRRLIGTAIAAAVGLTGWCAYENNYSNLIVSILTTKLEFLNLDEVDLNTFAHEFAADAGTFGSKGHLLALTYPVLRRADFMRMGKADTEIAEFEYRVVSKFLLSTDYFKNGADETRPVRYVAYNSPYRFACGNPFAQFE
jgi:hypothetical protein